ncbi:hypothetical protein ABG067_009451, partial [Albugo candida]
MSNNKGSARDYVESYIEKDAYLSQEQPRYDPSKPMSQPNTTPLEKEQEAQPVKASGHFKVHLPTQNPIPSTEKETETQQPQIQYT